MYSLVDLEDSVELEHVGPIGPQLVPVISPLTRACGGGYSNSAVDLTRLVREEHQLQNSLAVPIHQG